MIPAKIRRVHHISTPVTLLKAINWLDAYVYAASEVYDDYYRNELRQALITLRRCRALPDMVRKRLSYIEAAINQCDQHDTIRRLDDVIRVMRFYSKA